MKKKVLKIICWVLVALVLLVPIPVHYKDGGTVSYNAILYSVAKVHSITSSRYSDDGELEVGYAVGTRVRVLIFPVYDDVKEVYPEQEGCYEGYGMLKESDWTYGKMITGEVTQEFAEMLLTMPKPQDVELENKMTPFFNVFFDNRFYSNHYGTEVVICEK